MSVENHDLGETITLTDLRRHEGAGHILEANEEEEDVKSPLLVTGKTKPRPFNDDGDLNSMLPAEEGEYLDPLEDEDEDETHSRNQPTRESTIWDVYNNEARIVDRELVKDWMSNLNFLLLFAAIFSAVLSAFIIESKKMLEEDTGDLAAAVLIQLNNNLARQTHIVYERQPFVPSKSAIVINCLFFASLGSSLAAALATVVVSQWVVDYDAVASRGGASPKDRMRRRHFRFRGVRAWKMGEIIAALPILLYCSVVLFFSGLTQWMWEKHSTVGAIAFGGGVLMVSFYVVSMLLSVFFPSSPFRTPISRWVYSFPHFIYSIIPPIPRFLRPKNVSGFRFSMPTMKIRDNTLVQNDPTLPSDALVWLSTQISLSPDSHTRLRLLIQEFLASSSPPQQPNGTFHSAPLWEIFDLLGTRQIDRVVSNQYNDSDARELQILLHCVRNPHIGPFIAPGKMHEYSWTKNRADGYISYTEPRPKERRSAEFINRTYFLLQNLSIANDKIPSDIQLRHRLTHIRYARTKTLRVPKMEENWREIFQELENGRITHHSAMEQLAVALFTVPKTTREEHTNWLLLSLQSRNSIFNQPVYISTPSGKKAVMPASHIMTRLQSRSIDWIVALSKYPDKALIAILPALCHAQYRDLPPLWRFVATDEEVTQFMRSIHDQDKSAMLDLIESERRDYRFVEALDAFDQLLDHRDCLIDGVIDLVVDDLGLLKSSFYGDYFTEERKYALSKLRNPLLRLIACVVAGINWKDEWSQELNQYVDSPKEFKFSAWEKISRFCLKDHPSHHTLSIWNLRTHLWAYFDHERTKTIISQALRDYAPTGFTLHSLESGFEQKELGIEHGGDHLLAMIHLAMIRAEEYSIRSGWFIDTPREESLWSLWSSLRIFAISETSEKYLSELCWSIEGNQRRLMGLLIKVLRTETWRLTIGHLRMIIFIAKTKLLSNNMQPLTIDRHHLAELITQLQGVSTLNPPLFMQKVERECFRLECEEVIQGLLASNPPTPL